MNTLQAFRIAIRGEGAMVNGYLAENESMAGAILIASMPRSVLELSPELFEPFKTLLQATATAVAKLSLGVAVSHFEETPAPEHERMGRA